MDWNVLMGTRENSERVGGLALVLVGFGVVAHTHGPQNNKPVYTYNQYNNTPVTAYFKSISSFSCKR